MIIGIFCGSSSGVDPIYANAARDTGLRLARKGIEIVYGGGRVGLMGMVADAALAAGGRVTGVIPRALAEREIAHSGLTTLHVVQTMHERKAKMAELADAFIALPGGAGTLDELFEQWTWAQLGIHGKACGILNVNGYFDPLKEMTSRMVAEGFLHKTYADILAVTDDLDVLLTHFRSFAPPNRKWQTEGSAKVRP